MNVPEWDGEGTFTNRRFEEVIAKEIQQSESDDGSVHYGFDSGGWGLGISEKVAKAILATDDLTATVEWLGNRAVGWVVNGVWIERQSDEDLKRESEDFNERFAAERRASLKKNQKKWEAAEKALPAWLQERFETFHERGGEDFRLDGWGYELAVAQLAEMYVKIGDELLNYNLSTVPDTDEIEAFSQAEGTTGNQHSMAIALAKMHLTGTSVKETPSALTPLTGRPFFEKPQKDPDA